jgi:hypothetical protein
MSLLKDVKQNVDTIFCYVLVFLAFGFVFYLSLSFVYVEGDDASIVAYHALGRNPTLQPAYSVYQSMMDAVLSLLPARESIVRVAAMTMTTLSVPILFLLMVLLAIDWVGELLPYPRWQLVAIMLLAVPEFYYLGMVLTPAMIAMTLLVAAHFILRRSIVGTRRASWLGLGISIVLFGLGAAIRWDTVVYGATIAADLFLISGSRSKQAEFAIWNGLGLVLLWGLLAGIAWLVILDLNGYGLDSIVRAIRISGPVEPLDWKIALSRIHTLFTPAFVVLWVAGLLLLVRHRHPLAIITLLSILPVAKLSLYGTPKWIITTTPTFLACALAGGSVFWYKPWRRYALLVLTVTPWLLGIQMTYAGTAWGPGFELQPYARIPQKTSWPSVTFGPGMALPTPEGPRALFGHAWVFSGDWKRFVVGYWMEQENAVRTAVQRNVPLLLHDSEQGWGVVAYLALGYTTMDSYDRMMANGFVIERRWLGPGGTRSTMFRLIDPKQLLEFNGIERLREVTGDTVILSGFSNTFGRLYQKSPQSLDPLGKVTAVLYLDRLSTSLR